MIHRGQGIQIETSVLGNKLSFKVLEQSDRTTEAIKFARLINDEETGFSLKTNNHPSFNKGIKRFFVRGGDRNQNDKVVKVTFSSTREARDAESALGRMVSKINHEDIEDDDRMYRPQEFGSTTHLRFGLISRAQAQKLSLTGKDCYPINPEWPGAYCNEFPVKPIRVRESSHYNEHIGQGIDVLNKSVMPDAQIEGVVNPHKVTPQQAKKAVALLKECFNKAEREDFLIAWWRLISATRSIDVVD